MTQEILLAYRTMEEDLQKYKTAISNLECTFQKLSPKDQQKSASTYTEMFAGLDLRCKLLQSQIDEVKSWISRIADPLTAIAITLHYLEGYTWDQTGTILKVSPGAIARRVQRFVKKEAKKT